MVYTGNGDRGRTDLSSGERVSKSSERIQAYGTVDELNSLVGVCRSYATDKEGELEEIQNELHILQAELANREPDTKVTDENIDRLEDRCDYYQEECPPLRSFVLAGGCKSAAQLHNARSVARRAERKIVKLDQDVELREEVLAYINRLSDLLFLMARHENHLEGVEEKSPKY
ncbi:cob(I)yrinic acid a,c-diamide adenosyltransferase [Candidatus Nanohalobium constans]|uniref:Cob(I)alamin adenosyltransferase n=1 Tax=Candidatus Nanohalobium constans TaxID=2565781 RepID=A0A5Q0UH40_9ARCH|nr:cob(I)yrinic acid a,c-diamide adenosyltransferase [Candidatus Nanohalobium constans]QGA80904.1 cob(I)alamin adenosyltransferase [Candidatus Nanohalobium constans]